jgi:hypothetical protein
MTVRDELWEFQPGQKVTAEETNDNNDTLKHWIEDRSDITAYINAKIAEISTQYSDQISSINTQISSLNSQISGLSTNLNNKGYVKQSGAQVGIGTTQMSTYLPQDGKKYLVWFCAKLSEKSANQLTVASDILTTDRLVYKLDGDAGRSSEGTVFSVIPASSNGWIKFTGKKDYLALIGYCRL